MGALEVASTHIRRRAVIFLNFIGEDNILSCAVLRIGGGCHKHIPVGGNTAADVQGNIVYTDIVFHFGSADGTFQIRAVAVVLAYIAAMDTSAVGEFMLRVFILLGGVAILTLKIRAAAFIHPDMVLNLEGTGRRIVEVVSAGDGDRGSARLHIVAVAEFVVIVTIHGIAMESDNNTGSFGSAVIMHRLLFHTDVRDLSGGIDTNQLNKTAGVISNAGKQIFVPAGIVVAVLVFQGEIHALHQYLVSVDGLGIDESHFRNSAAVGPFLRRNCILV